MTLVACIFRGNNLKRFNNKKGIHVAFQSILNVWINFGQFFSDHKAREL